MLLGCALELVSCCRLSSSWKLDLRSHPSLVVLSVIDSAQSSGLRRPASMSTHGVMMAAMCSSRLFDAR